MNTEEAVPDNGRTKQLPKNLEEIDLLRWQLMSAKAKSASVTVEYYGHMLAEAERKLEAEKVEARELLETLSTKYGVDFRFIHVGFKGELIPRQTNQPTG